VILAAALQGVVACPAWAASQSRATAAAGAPSRGDLLDINTATAEQLRSLPGMGEAYVRRIIAGRPYTAKNQLIARGILPQGAYDQISTLIIAKRLK
jgi:DNA uptake protein ComE-like DNA-binding protein